jgi:subtilisin family serine protease
LLLGNASMGSAGAWPAEDHAGFRANARAADVSTEVDRMLARGEMAEVLIAIDDHIDDREASIDALAVAVARAQDVLIHDLASLGPDEFDVATRYKVLPILHARIGKGALARLRYRADVVGIEAVTMVYPLSAPASPAGSPNSLKEALPSIGVDLVHSRYGITGEGIGVSVLDTGIDNDHPDFEEAIVDQQCFSSGSRSCAPNNLPKSTNAEDEQGHGTSVSSIVLGRGNEAPLGVAPEAKLVAVRVFRDSGGAPTNDIVDGLDWTLQRQTANNIKVVNMSLGGGASIGQNCDNEYAAVKSSFQRLGNRGISIFVATGNGGNTDRVAFPACISNSVGIGSTWDTELDLGRPNCHDKTRVGPMDITCYTDRGRAMDFVAPGSVIVTAKMGGGATGSGPTAGGHGTSFASPMAAGVAALLLQIDPKLRQADIERIFKNTADVIKHPDTEIDVYRINALRAVESILPPTPTPENTATAEPTDTAQPPTVTNTPEPDPPTETPEPATETPVATDTATPEPGAEIYLPVLRNGGAG